MRKPEEILRAMEIIAIASNDVLDRKNPDEGKLHSFAMGLMALSWARQDGSNMDTMFQEMIDACNAVDAGKPKRHRHRK